jgi:hypothetical protein
VTDPATLAAVSTPARDLRDEVWVRVYAATFARSSVESPWSTAAAVAAEEADAAVARLPIPAHRKPEDG